MFSFGKGTNWRGEKVDQTAHTRGSASSTRLWTRRRAQEVALRIARAQRMGGLHDWDRAQRIVQYCSGNPCGRYGWRISEAYHYHPSRDAAPPVTPRLHRPPPTIADVTPCHHARRSDQSHTASISILAPASNKASGLDRTVCCAATCEYNIVQSTTNDAWTQLSMLAVSRLIADWKSVVSAPSDCDPAGETSRGIVLQFSLSVFTKQTRGPIVGTDLC
jgi:hypothetical protein